MATVNLTSGELGRSNAGTRPVFMAEQRIDFGRNNAAASDVVQALNVYAGWFVHAVAVDVEVAEGGTGTATVGDGTTANGFIASVNLNATGITKNTLKTDGTSAAVGYTAGKLYTADDTIDLVVSAALDKAVVVVRALVTDFGTSV